MGPLAFGIVVARGLIRGGGVEATLETACICLFVFAAIGCLIGWAAGLIVEDSVRARFEAERKSQRAESSTETPDSA
jgi:hypothetical protein